MGPDTGLYWDRADAGVGVVVGVADDADDVGVDAALSAVPRSHRCRGDNRPTYRSDGQEEGYARRNVADGMTKHR